MLNPKYTSIKKLMWEVPEEDYRADSAYSYSGIAAFAKEGPSILINPSFKESAALRNGSLLDCILTNPTEVDNLFVVMDVPEVSEKNREVLDTIWRETDSKLAPLTQISSDLIKDVMDRFEFYSNWKVPTRISKLMEIGEVYYNSLASSLGKTIVPIKAYNTTIEAAQLLKTKEPFAQYFNINPFQDNVEIFYQAKFKTILNEIPVRIMLDFIKIDHLNKTIELKDLKSTGAPEEDFSKSFLKWRYDIQGSLYKDVVQHIISKDEYFKDFKILPFSFIVINVNNLNPIEWIFTPTFQTALYNTTIYKPYSTLLKEIKWHIDFQIFYCTVETYINNFQREISLPFIIIENESSN